MRLRGDNYQETPWRRTVRQCGRAGSKDRLCNAAAWASLGQPVPRLAQGGGRPTVRRRTVIFGLARRAAANGRQSGAPPDITASCNRMQTASRHRAPRHAPPVHYSCGLRPPPPRPHRGGPTGHPRGASLAPRRQQQRRHRLAHGWAVHQMARADSGRDGMARKVKLAARDAPTPASPRAANSNTKRLGSARRRRSQRG